MSLSKKTLIIVSVAFIGLMTVLYLMTSQILFQGFDRVEEDAMKNDVERVLSAVEYEIGALDTTTGDYAGWDDTYAFAQKRDEKYVKVNMNNTTFTQLKINIVIIMNNRGEMVFGTGYDGKEDKQVPLSAEITEHFRPGRFLAFHDRIDGKKTGILKLKNGGMIISSRPILTSKFLGPIMGTIVMGRNIDAEVLSKWAKLTKTELSLHPSDHEAAGPNGGAEKGADRIVVRQKGPNVIEGYAQISDVYGKPAYLLQVGMARPVHQQEVKTIGSLIAASLLAFLIFGATIVWLLKKSIIIRMLRISQDVRKIGMEADFSARVDAEGDDELAWLGREINGMIAKLEESALELRKVHHVVQQTNEILLEQIEERKRTEAALRQSEERFMTIFQASPTPKALIVADDKTVFDINERFTGRFGYLRPDVLGKKLKTFFQSTTEEWDDVNRKFKKLGFLRDEYARMLTKNGELRDCLISVEQVSIHDQGIVILSIQDMTEYKRMEIRLQRAQKMEALGVLAGGVAHDLNNTLAGLVGYPEMLMMQLPGDSPLLRHLKTIQSSGEKVAAIVQDLLTMARRGVPVEDDVFLNQLLRSYLESPEHRRLAGEHREVSFVVDLADDLLAVHGSAVHLNKTILNLVLNAVEAMPAGGTLRIETRNQYVDCPVAGYDEVREGEYVVMEISDTGHGISAEDIEHIFEPFYTKKIMGRSGSGLGLAVVWGTVKDHHGYIDVKSGEHGGTSFTIYLPAARNSLASGVKKQLSRNIQGKGETILVIDDIEEQRELAQLILTGLGYQVATAASGEEAIAYLRRHRIDLLVLDMIMDPGMDGLDTYQGILQINPCQKAIIVSGFSETDRVVQAQMLGAGAYVRKPFVMEKLAVAVREELDKRQDARSTKQKITQGILSSAERS